MKKLILSALFIAGMAAVPKPAEAKLFEVWGSALMGGAFGSGKSQKDFYSWASGGAVGVEAGARILFLGAYIDYLRFFGGDTGANLLGLNLGGDGTFDFPGGLSLVFRLAGTYYIGSLDGAGPVTAVQTRGVGFRGGLGLRYTFLKILSVGCTPQAGYHYFFGGVDDNILTDNSHGWDVQVMGYFRVGLGI